MNILTKNIKVYVLLVIQHAVLIRIGRDERISNTTNNKIKLIIRLTALMSFLEALRVQEYPIGIEIHFLTL